MITPTKNNSLKSLCISLFFSLAFLQNSSAQISFSQSNLNFNGNGNVNSVTGMTFGPDGRLYVVEYPGAIKIFSIERTGPTNYNVTDLEVLNGILTIQDHNDDGTLHNATFRETIGIAIGGTAANPVFYVSSSDFRIGAGSAGGNGDVGLDTNSGIITRFSWNGASWDVVDIVRGLPRSEENHATNGLELATINGTSYLIAASGGHTNGGAPSTNFVYTCEYALSAAVLSINLDMLNAMPILNDNGRSYIYDLPTLDDPTRPNVNGITDPDNPDYDGVDVGDPFGGNDGLNMAIIDPAGPVQILSPGYRNAYDLVVTESGALYVTDNGANQGWGGLPENEGTANVTNDYNPTEPGSTASNPAPSGESVDNVDHLQLVTTDLNTYTFNSLYGGHPNPIRANPQGAGLYTDNTSALGTFGPPIWRTKIYHPNAIALGENFTNNPNEGLPANWPPVPFANPVEGDWRGPTVFNPDGPQDNPVVTWGTNTNSIDEYTASNFGGVLKGNLMAGHSSGNIRRVILSPDGASGTLTPNFFSGIGGNVLGLTCNGDTDIFPGTVWAGTLNGKIVVMEPQDAVDCIAPNDPAYDPLADYDDDGYTNQDEVDNGTDPCNGGSQPSDFDKVLGPPFISDLNDPDDDGDGIPDSEDPFQLGDPLATGSQAFTIPIANDLFNDQQGLGGIFGLGMTGLMNNGDPNPNWLNWIDRRDDPNDPNPNDVLGGAPGIMTSHMTSGTALGAANNQEKGYQYGVQVNSDTEPFSVIGGMIGFSGSDLRLYGNTAAVGGELGFFIGDGTQSNYIKFVVTVDGFTVLQEIGDVPQTPVNVTIPEPNRPSGGIRFYFVINPSTGAVSCDYQIDANPRTNITSLIAQGSILEALQQNTKDLAVGFIGTSGVNGVELEGSWDFLNVLGSQPTTILELPDITRLVGSEPESINLNSYFTDDGGNDALTYTVETNTDVTVSALITDNILNLVFPLTPALSVITIRATDADTNFVEQSFIVNVTEEPFVLYRVNAGGPEVIAIDDDINWSADTAGANSEFLVVAGSNSTFNATLVATTGAVDTSKVPLSIFGTERFDSAPGQPNLTYAFPVAENGNYEVRLYMMNGFNGTSQPGQRIFNATVEGNFYPQLLNIDLSARYGHQVGAVISQIVPVNDGVIDIIFLHDIENPLINGIEILKASSINTPIYVNHIDDQLSFPGEALDGSLGVVATGGDGNLQFDAVGLPSGVTIDPTNGQIGGTVGIDAADNSPYLVTITVDDSDAISSDAVTLQFTWVVETLAFAIEPIENLNSFVDDTVQFSVVTNGGDPTETITFAIQNQPDGLSIDATTGIISGTIASGDEFGGPNSDGIYTVTITATGSVSGVINIVITWTVSEKQLVFFRLNAGGTAVASTDGELDWVANNTTGAVNGAGYTVNTGSIATSGLTYANRHVSIPSYIDEATYNAIFAQERWDPAPVPEMQFNIPLPNGDYMVNIYMGNNYEPTSQVGQRVFDISIEGTLVRNNLDLIVEFGHQSGGMLSFPVTLTDGEINILFEHVTQNPLLNAIEIISRDGLIYNGTAWIPNAPNQTTSTENALILNGSYAVNSDIEINNLSVRNGASLIVEAGKSITAHGDLKINGTLELQSTSTSYSSLIANGTVEGNVVYKRHVNRTALPGQSGANDLIAPPLSGQAFNDFVVNNPNIVSNSANTLFLFGPFNKTNGSYVIYSNTETAPLQAGIGYRAASTDTSTFTFTGNVNTGPIAIPIINSGPFYQIWNLIGNPYPSYINAAAFLSANTTEFSQNSAAIYGYDGDASDGWVIWNQAYTDSNPDALISPGQGFFVTSKPTGGTVNFTPSMRSKGDSDDFIAGRNSSTLPSYLKLNLSQNEKSYHTDFYFNPNASRGLDRGYDAQVWGGNAPNFSIFSYLVEENTGSPMAIQSLGETDYNDLLIPLGIKANLGDQLTVSIAETTLPNTVDVYLEDYLLQTSTLLNNSDYILTPINSLNTLGRFYLSLTDSALSTNVSILNTLNVFSNAQNQSIVITGVITEPTVAKLYDIQGRLVLSKSLSLKTSQQNIDAQHLDKGVYVISIANNLEKMTKKIIIR